LKSLLAVVRAEVPDAVFSTIVGRAAQSFYRQYPQAGFDPERVPIASLTMAEGEIREIGPELCVGHLTAATYFGSLTRDSNQRFKSAFHQAFGPDQPVSMWSAGAYAQVKLFAAALERAGTLDTQKLVEAALGLGLEAPEGPIQIDPDNNHTFLMPRIGRTRSDGEFDIVWEAKALVKPDPYLAVSPLGARWISDEAVA
jgi:branched-chain amino acid transport system substrate-binding protein